MFVPFVLGECRPVLDCQEGPAGRMILVCLTLQTETVCDHLFSALEQQPLLSKTAAAVAATTAQGITWSRQGRGGRGRTAVTPRAHKLALKTKYLGGWDPDELKLEPKWQVGYTGQQINK